jgi:hypothetical protein
VVGELAEVRLWLLVDALERLADLPMEPKPAGRGQLVVKDVADQLVREAEAIGRSRGHNALGGCVGHELENLGRRGLANKPERFEAELATEDGSECQNGPALLGEPSETVIDHRTNAMRDRKSRERCEPCICQLSLRDEEPYHLS